MLRMRGYLVQVPVQTKLGWFSGSGVGWGGGGGCLQNTAEGTLRNTVLNPHNAHTGLCLEFPYTQAAGIIILIKRSKNVQVFVSILSFRRILSHPFLTGIAIKYPGDFTSSLYKVNCALTNQWAWGQTGIWECKPSLVPKSWYCETKGGLKLSRIIHFKE